MEDDELLATLERMRDTMTSVATGGPRIPEVNGEYKSQYLDVDGALRKRGITNPNQFSDLWSWHGRWTSGDMTNYKARRAFLAEMFDPLLRQIRDRINGIASRVEEPTGWLKVDRTVAEIRRRLTEARSEEQFQAVGLLCREALISAAQAVYDVEKHPSTDDVKPSETDAKRMLDAYFAAELQGRSNETIRRHARSVVDLAVELQHRRTAAFRAAALCEEATTSVINVLAIISGRRDPKAGEPPN